MLLVPVRASDGDGVIFLADLRVVGRDLLPLGVAVSREVAFAFDRHVASLSSYRQGMDELRQDMARDLHDSVAQSLAGAAFRVEAATRAIATGRQPEAELRVLSEALRGEQRHVRAIIERLREGRPLPMRHDLADEIETILIDARLQWNLSASLRRPETAIVVGRGQLHDLRQIVREAIANAAKHGNASDVEITLAAEDRVFFMDIVDNGAATDSASAEFSPRSIAARVAALGGQLEARRGPAGARLYITVPRLSA